MNKIYFLIVCFVLTVSSFSQKENLRIPYKFKGKWGYSDINGDLKIKAEYDTVHIFKSDYAFVEKDGKKGVLNLAGNQILATEYEHIFLIAKNEFAVKKDNLYSIVDVDGNVLLDYKYEGLQAIGNNLIKYTKDKKIGMLHLSDGQYEVLIPALYTRIDYQDYKKTFVCSKADGTEDKLIYDGEKVIKQKNLNENDEEVIEAFDFAMDEPITDFSDNGPRYPVFKSVKIGNKIAITKTDKKYVRGAGHKVYTDTFPGTFDYYREMSNRRLLYVKEGKGWGIMSDKGVLVLDPEYEEIDSVMSTIYGFTPYKHRFYVKKKGKWGVVANKVEQDKITSKGEVVIPFEYDFIRGHFRDFVVVSKKGKLGVYSIRTFQLLTEIKYKKIIHKFIYGFKDFMLFLVQNENGDTFYVGENGVEFYTK